MAPGAKSKLGAPVAEPEVFRKQMYGIAESTSDIVGTSRRPPKLLCSPSSDSTLGETIFSCFPYYAPAWNVRRE